MAFGIPWATLTRFTSLATIVSVTTTAVSCASDRQSRTAVTVASSRPVSVHTSPTAASARRTKVAFTTGHGERDPNSGLQVAWAVLAEGYDLTLVNPSLEAIDQTVDIVAVVGPTEPFDGRGRDEIDRFLRSGKGGLFLVDGMVMRVPLCSVKDGQVALGAETAVPNDAGLTPLLVRYGLHVATDLVLDAKNVPGPFQYQGRTVLDNLPTFVGVVVNLTEPPNVARPTPVIFPYASSVEEVPGPAVPITRMRSLADSSSQSWRQNEYVYWSSDERTLKPKGPFSLARAVEFGEPAQHQGRIVVVGDSDFASDHFLKMATFLPVYDGGRIFLRTLIDWISIRS
jgi:hypothetical protein